MVTTPLYKKMTNSIQFIRNSFNFTEGSSNLKSIRVLRQDRTWRPCHPCLKFQVHVERKKRKPEQPMVSCLNCWVTTGGLVRQLQAGCSCRTCLRCAQWFSHLIVIQGDFERLEGGQCTVLFCGCDCENYCPFCGTLRSSAPINDLEAQRCPKKPLCPLITGDPLVRSVVKAFSSKDKAWEHRIPQTLSDLTLETAKNPKTPGGETASRLEPSRLDVLGMKAKKRSPVFVKEVPRKRPDLSACSLEPTFGRRTRTKSVKASTGACSTSLTTGTLTVEAHNSSEQSWL